MENYLIEDRIIAYLTENLCKDEKVKFEAWLNESEENRFIYERVSKVYFQTYLAYREKAPVSKVQKEYLLKKIFSSRFRFIQLGIAASIILLLSIGLFLWNKKTNLPLQIAQVEIKPVNKQAVLILSDGKEIDITSLKNSNINDDGTIITIDNGVYYNEEGDSNEDVQYNTIRVPRGGEFFVQLPDGTKVWLNSESEITFPVKFTGNQREVLFKGEAYFDVTYNSEKMFVVKSDEYNLSVYGTKFNLNTYNKKDIKAVLVSGSIGVRGNNTTELRLEPYELGVVNLETGETYKKVVKIYPYIAWKEQKIVFNDEPLDAIMENLSRWYDFEVVFSDESLKELSFYANMERYEEIQNVLYYLEQTSNVKFTISGKQVIVSYK